MKLKPLSLQQEAVGCYPIFRRKKHERREEKEEERTREILAKTLEVHARFWEQNQRVISTVFFHVFQPSLAVSWGGKSRGNSGKISDLMGESLG